VWYKLGLPEDMITTGALSALQLEAVTYAAQQHEHFLPDGSRAGFLIGESAVMPTIYIISVLTKHTLCYNYFLNESISKKLKLILKNTLVDKTLTYASETCILAKRYRKEMNIFERKVYRRILGPICDKEK
jgi:hypothetical protein